jgi:hypothetical protein
VMLWNGETPKHALPESILCRETDAPLWTSMTKQARREGSRLAEKAVCVTCVYLQDGLGVNRLLGVESAGSREMLQPKLTQSWSLNLQPFGRKQSSLGEAKAGEGTRMSVQTVAKARQRG